MSFDHHDDLALKTSNITANRDFAKRMLLSISSKTETKVSKSILLWLGDLYITATYHFLFCIITSKTRHSGKDVMSAKYTIKNSLYIINTNTTPFDVTWVIRSNYSLLV